MKFKHKITGVILEPHNEMVIKQMKASEIYEEIAYKKENKKKEK